MKILLRLLLVIAVGSWPFLVSGTSSSVTGTYSGPASSTWSGHSGQGCSYNGQWTTDGSWYFGGQKECLCSGGRWSQCREPPRPPPVRQIPICEPGYLYDETRRLCIKRVEESPVYICEGQGCQTVLDSSYSTDFCSSRLCVCKIEDTPRFACADGFKLVNQKCERKIFQEPYPVCGPGFFLESGGSRGATCVKVTQRAGRAKCPSGFDLVDDDWSRKTLCVRTETLPPVFTCTGNYELRGHECVKKGW